MPVETISKNYNKPRLLRNDEKVFLIALLSNHPNFLRFKKEISSSRVQDMSDGDIGSIKFVLSEPRSLGLTVIEADYVDVDGVLVSIAINTDELGRLYEVDFWKVDFSSLKQYPRLELVKIKHKY